MWNNFIVVTASVFSLFLMMGVGFLFGRKGLLGEQTISQMSKLLLTVAAPALVIESLQVDFSVELLKTLGIALMVTVLLYVLYGGMVLLLFRRQPEATRSVLRFGVMFGNIGFMGMPLILSVLGQEAVIFCAISLIVFNIGNWTYGVALLGEKISLRKAVANPGVIGGAIALALFLLRIRLPGPILSAVGYIGDLNTPLAMVVIGGQMASADLPATFRQSRLYLAAALKLVAVPLLTVLVLAPFHLDSMLVMTLAILSGCPTAGATSMFAQMFRKDTVSAAQLVTLSTILCIATLPLVAVVAQYFTG